MNNSKKISTVLFFLSFTPYFILIFYFGIEGINFGMQGIAHFYGLTAVIIGFIFLCILGVIPLFLAFQITFGKKYISQNARLRKATKILITVLVVTLILISPISYGVNKIRVMTEPSRITEYLADKYGEEMAGQARIEYDHGGLSEARYYKIYTPVLPDGEYFELYYDPIHNKNQRMQDDLMNRFISVNSFYTSDYEEYIYGKNIIPDDITLIERNLLSIDFKDYQHGDDYTALFNRTIYDIKMISVDANDDSEETINQIIDKIWSNEYLRYAAKNTITAS